MSHCAAAVLSTLLLAALVAPAAAQTQAQTQAPPFVTGTFDAIRARAKTEGRALVVDFSNDACEPCRRLLQTSWQDAALWKWLGEHALVARVDPEQDRAAATALDVRAYPTIVVLGKDGSELTRILGWVDATTLRGKLSAVIHVHPTDYRARLKLGDNARAKGDLDGALDHYLFLWDHGDEHNPTFSGVRSSSLSRTLGELARKHPPTRSALEQRRDAIEQRLLAGKIALQTVQDLVALARALRATERLPELLDRVPPDAWARQRVAREVLVEASIDALLAQKRHADALRLVGDPVKRLADDLRMPAGMPRMPEPIESQLLARKIEQHAKVLEACYAQHDARSAALVDALLEARPGVETWKMMLQAAKRSGNDVAAHDLAVRALQQLPESEHEPIRAFLQRK